MAGSKAFNSVVSARTRAAKQILATPELLAGYEALGGLAADLESIRDAGLRAEAANLGQSQATATGAGATLDVLSSFAALQKEYAAVMAIVRAAHHDLEEKAGPAEVLAAIDQILVNEAEVALSDVTDADGKKKKSGHRSVSHEALRAEIEKDAGALLALDAAAGALAARRVDAARLGRLRSGAQELAGKLGERTSKKAERKTATEVENQAVADQRKRWGSSYRLLASLGARDQRVAALLKEAAR